MIASMYTLSVDRFLVNLGHISKQEKRPYYLLLSFLILTALIIYREDGAMSFVVSNNILNIVEHTTLTIGALISKGNK